MSDQLYNRYGADFLQGFAGRPATAHEISCARMLYERLGEIEIDDAARVSEAEGHPDGGCYISAWVWVPDAGAEEGEH